jgi:glucose/mannose-6-phosphate isomerase
MVQMVLDSYDEDPLVPASYSEVSNVVISGMGGSGIAGDIIVDLTRNSAPKPVFVCKGTRLPAFAGRETLVITMSYSGNTIETISAFEDAVSRGCKVFGITGGGILERLFVGHGLPFAKLSGGYLPREAMPQMLAILLRIFERLEWAEVIPDMEDLAAQRDRIEFEAEGVAKKLLGKVVIIYSDFPSVAHRFKSQLNENSKAIAKYDIIPEFAHNEINSWSDLGGDFHIVFMRDPNEDGEVSRMVEISKKMLRERQYTEIRARGNSLMTKILYLVWFGDFVSHYLAVEKGVNPDRVYATEFLKSELARTQLNDSASLSPTSRA